MRQELCLHGTAPVLSASAPSGGGRSHTRGGRPPLRLASRARWSDPDTGDPRRGPDPARLRPSRPETAISPLGIRQRRLRLAGRWGWRPMASPRWHQTSAAIGAKRRAYGNAVTLAGYSSIGHRRMGARLPVRKPRCPASLLVIGHSEGRTSGRPTPPTCPDILRPIVLLAGPGRAQHTWARVDADQMPTQTTSRASHLTLRVLIVLAAGPAGNARNLVTPGTLALPARSLPRINSAPAQRAALPARGCCDDRSGRPALPPTGLPSALIIHGRRPTSRSRPSEAGPLANRHRH